ncbi:MAG: heparinase II/III family protein [Planctomycetota bacterium]
MALNLTLEDARKNVQVLFKSSPFGTQSHGYEAQNSFLLNAFGERLLIRSGYRDLYGSAHHKDWMWHTRSVNSITLGGRGQGKRTAAAVGRITEFHTSEVLDYVSGEAAAAYGGLLNSFARRVLFLKPDLIVIFDTLLATEPTTFEWWLHAENEMMVKDQTEITVTGKIGAAKVSFLAPENLEIRQTNRFDPPPRPRIKLVQWHLFAATQEPKIWASFVTVIRPYERGTSEPGPVSITPAPGVGYTLTANLPKRSVSILLASEPTQSALGTPRVTVRSSTSDGDKELFASDEMCPLLPE